MDIKRKMENTLENLAANIFNTAEYEEVYIILNSGILLTQEPLNFDSSIPVKFASMVLAMEYMGPIQDMRVRYEEKFDMFISRINDRSFIVVKTKKGTDETVTFNKMEKVSIAVKESIPWLR
jgi:hypothetical protein